MAVLSRYIRSGFVLNIGKSFLIFDMLFFIFKIFLFRSPSNPLRVNEQGDSKMKIFRIIAFIILTGCTLAGGYIVYQSLMSQDLPEAAYLTAFCCIPGTWYLWKITLSRNRAEII